ncbi:MAG: hypothetical protein V4812_11690 [Pseudomonadota bacterium]
MLALLKRLFGKKAAAANSEAAFVLSIVDGEIISRRPEGSTERVALTDLRAVIIETNDSGPWGSDLWWILVGSQNNGCVFPGGATGEQVILAALQQLPGFDNERLMQAMTSIGNGRFLCWENPIDPRAAPSA